MAKSKIVNIKSANKNKRKHEKKDAKSKRKNKQKNEKKVASNMTPAEKKKAMRNRLITLVIIGFILISAGYSAYKIGVLQMDKHKLDEENIDLRREKALLEEELKNVQDYEYIEEEAREKLNLIMPGEVIYKFPDDEKGK